MRVGRTPIVRGAPRPCVFLDRDGVINEEVEYLGDPAKLAMIAGAADAIAALSEAVEVIVVTNQAGIARGYYDVAGLAAVTERIADHVERSGGRIAATYYCPHHPSDLCRCRKPAPGMIEEASRELGLDPARSVLVGDKASDLVAARAAGCTAVLVRTGHGAHAEAAAAHDAVFDTLAQAVPWVLARLKARVG